MSNLFAPHFINVRVHRRLRNQFYAYGVAGFATRISEIKQLSGRSMGDDENVVYARTVKNETWENTRVI